MKLKYFLVFIVFLISGLSCTAKDEYSVTHIQDIVKQWTVIESRSPVFLTEDIEKFSKSIQSYLDSEMYRIYRLAPYSPKILVGIQEPNEIQEIHTVVDLSISLLEAVSSGDHEKARLISADISGNLVEVVIRSTEVEEYISGAYIRLFFVFIIILILSVILILFLNKELSRSLQREKEGTYYSHAVLQAQENERKRIALELHDTVAQDLWRLSFQTDSIDKTTDPLERSRLCGDVVKGQKNIMQQIRAICDSLIPPGFQQRGLIDTLRSLCYDFQQRTGIEVQLAANNDLKTSQDSDLQLHCFRIVQECLANIEKHAQATEVQVLVRCRTDHDPDNDFLVVCVSDNGKGFSPPNRDSYLRFRTEGYFGLWGIYERVSSLSGTLTIDSEAGEGTVITLQIPFSAGEKK